MNENNLLFYSWLYAFLGWLTGVLSSIIIFHTNRYYKLIDAKTMVLAELKHLCVFVCANYFDLSTSLGTMSKQGVESIKKIYEIFPDEFTENEKKLLDTFLSMSIDELKSYNLSKQINQKKYIGIKKVLLPFSEGNISNFGFLKQKYKLLLAKIFFDINILNEEIDNQRYFFKLTFDKTAMENYGKEINHNIYSSQKASIQRYKLINQKLLDFLEII